MDDLSGASLQELRALALSGDEAALDRLLRYDRAASFAAAQRGVPIVPLDNPQDDRAELQAELDRIYNRVWRWRLDERMPMLDVLCENEQQKNAMKAEHDRMAKYIFADVMNLASRLTTGIRSNICPTFDSADPAQMRRALVELLFVVHPVLPGAPVAGNCLETDDLVRWLRMLDEGATPDIFKANVQKTPGFRETDWTRKRYRALMAVWCIHLRNNCYFPNGALDVAIAFGHTNSRYHEAIRNKAGQMIAAARAGESFAGLTPFDVQQAVALAMAGRTESGTIERRIMSRSFCNIIFGADGVAADSMEEAGRLYQEFKAANDGGKGARPATR